MFETATQETAAAARYANLEIERSPYLTRAREAAAVTIASIMPPEGSTGTTKLPTPWQGIGARGVNNLSAKLLLALLPPNYPFFRLKVDEQAIKEAGEGQEALLTKVEQALSGIEKSVMNAVETEAFRVATYEALRHLIVVGNVLMYFPQEGGVRAFHLDKYVVKRDPMGTVLEIVVQENLAPAAIPERVKPLLDSESLSNEKTVNLFTRVWREGKEYRVQQEVNGHVVPDSHGTYPEDKVPWLALRFTRVDGESYGRGFVEEYQGDLNSLESLSESLVLGSAAAAKVLFLTKPNGITNPRTLNKAQNGEFVTGNPDDIHALQLDKFHDFRTAAEQMAKIENRLAYAFLLNTSIQRKGERVTAEEIRWMAGELEDALGGAYSILSQEFQYPLVTVLMTRLTKQGKVPRLPKGSVQPAIITGLEALGRGHDLRRLDAFMEGLSRDFGPEVIEKYVHFTDYATRRATALGLDTEGLIKTEEDIQAAEQQAQMQQMVERLGPNAVNQIGGMMQQGGMPQMPDGAAPEMTEG